MIEPRKPRLLGAIVRPRSYTSPHTNADLAHVKTATRTECSTLPPLVESPISSGATIYQVSLLDSATCKPELRAGPVLVRYPRNMCSFGEPHCRGIWQSCNTMLYGSRGSPCAITSPPSRSSVVPRDEGFHYLYRVRLEYLYHVRLELPALARAALNLMVFDAKGHIAKQTLNFRHHLSRPPPLSYRAPGPTLQSNLESSVRGIEGAARDETFSGMPPPTRFTRPSPGGCRDNPAATHGRCGGMPC